MRRYSSRRMTDGSRMATRAECRKCPFSSSVMATPLSTSTRARRAAQTLIGSYDAFRTRTGASSAWPSPGRCTALAAGEKNPAPIREVGPGSCSILGIKIKVSKFQKLPDPTNLAPHSFRHGGLVYSVVLDLSVFRCQFQGARCGGDPDLAGSGAAQDAGTLRRGGAGGIDIIHKNDVAASDFGGTFHRKGPAQVLTTLMTRQANLRMRVADAFEQIDADAQPFILQLLECSPGNQFRLVESTQPTLAFEQGHGNHQNRGLFKLRPQTGNRLCQHSPKDRGCRAYAGVLQKMNQFAHSAVVAAVGYGALE